MPTRDLLWWDETYWELWFIAFLTAIFSFFALCGFLNVFFVVLSPQHVSSVRQALSPPWVTSINGGMFFLQTWRPPVSMWATPNVTVWMVGVFVLFYRKSENKHISQNVELFIECRLVNAVNITWMYMFEMVVIWPVPPFRLGGGGWSYPEWSRKLR